MTEEELKIRRIGIEQKYLTEKVEQSSIEYKRDCRRTALQLASRSGNLGPTEIIEDAQRFFDWLTIPEDAVDQRMITGKEI